MEGATREDTDYFMTEMKNSTNQEIFSYLTNKEGKPNILQVLALP